MVQHQVSLRPFQPDDAERITLLLNDKAVIKHLRDVIPNPYSIDDANKFIDLTSKYSPLNHFAIIYDGDLVGAIGIHPETDVYRYSAEIGYWIGKAYWNKGIGSKAVSQIVSYGLNAFTLNRIQARVFAGNWASKKVLERNGFIEEALLKDHVYKNGRFVDEYMMVYFNSNVDL